MLWLPSGCLSWTLSLRCCDGDDGFDSQEGNFWQLVLMIANSTKVILDGFETKHVTGNSLSDELET